MLMIILILALNLGISWWNCYAVGRIWEETKATGGFIRLLCWCGAVQSAVGFSSVILAVLGYGAYALGYLPPEIAKQMVSLWWLLVIIPCVGTGIIITCHSWAMWWRERSLMNLGTAAYNTFAQIHNTVSLVQNFGPALKDAGGLFEAISDSDDPRATIVLLAIALVVISLAGGIFITMALIKKYSGTIELPDRPVLSDRYADKSLV